MHYEINLQDIQQYNTHTDKLNIKTAALVVIEMQEAFRSGMEMISPKQISNVKLLINFANEYGAKIIYVRHNDSSETSKHMVKWWGGDKLEYASDAW